jgi:potassium-transporting ATPase KdpC subunit
MLIDLGRQLAVAMLFTVVTTALFGLGYPLAVTGTAQLLFREQANGSLIERNGRPVGSPLIGQRFSTPGYFWPRPSAAGHGYDAAASGGSNLGPTSATLVARVAAERERLAATNPDQAVPVELVTTSASGLDPDLSPAGAAFQVPRVARERGVSEVAVSDLVTTLAVGRQLGFLGEPRVNVLELNLALDDRYPISAKR